MKMPVAILTLFCLVAILVSLNHRTVITSPDPVRPESAILQQESVMTVSSIRPWLKSIAATYFSFICHQDPTILARIEGEAVPLCPRCIGLHLGFFLAWFILLMTMSKRFKPENTISHMLLLAALGTLGLEWGLAHLGLITSTFYSRLITGLAGGAAFGILFVLYQKSTTQASRCEPLALNTGHIGGMVCLVIAAGLLFSLIKDWTAYVFVILIVVAMNFLMILYTLFRRITSFFQFLNH